jgi:hypothetical protein
MNVQEALAALVKAEVAVEETAAASNAADAAYHAAVRLMHTRRDELGKAIDAEKTRLLDGLAS